MDPEVVLLIAAAVVGIAVGILHLVGYVPPRYRKMLAEVQAGTAKAISEALEARLAPLMGEGGSYAQDTLTELPRILQELPIKIGQELTAALRRAQEEALKQFTAAEAIPPQVTGAIGGLVNSDRRKDRELTDAIGRGLLGPYGAILEQVFPPLYDYLTANPDMVVRALEMPVVQKLIQQGSRAMGGLKVGDTTLSEAMGRVVR